MKISELIERLKEIHDQVGDLHVMLDNEYFGVTDLEPHHLDTSSGTHIIMDATYCGD